MSLKFILPALFISFTCFGGADTPQEKKENNFKTLFEDMNLDDKENIVKKNKDQAPQACPQKLFGKIKSIFDFNKDLSEDKLNQAIQNNQEIDSKRLCFASYLSADEEREEIFPLMEDTDLQNLKEAYPNGSFCYYAVKVTDITSLGIRIERKVTTKENGNITAEEESIVFKTSLDDPNLKIDQEINVENGKTNVNTKYTIS